jgi:hypothetical protein
LIPALVPVADKVGITMAANMVSIRATISSSMSENPHFLRFLLLIRIWLSLVADSLFDPYRVHRNGLKLSHAFSTPEGRIGHVGVHPARIPRELLR